MIKIGQKCEIVNTAKGLSEGLIVTVTGYAGGDMGLPQGPRWYIDTWVKTVRGTLINHVGEKQLKPIYDGNEPISWEDERCAWVPSREKTLL